MTTEHLDMARRRACRSLARPRACRSLEQAGVPGYPSRVLLRAAAAAAALMLSCAGVSNAAAEAAAPPQQPEKQQSPPAGSLTPQSADALLRVCSDPNNLPQSNSRGEGYENKIAQALARDLRKKVEYTFFPQRMGFVRNTLRARDDATQQFKCDVIIGVPKGYELTATTQPYMHSTYALVATERADLKSLKTAEDVLKLPTEKLHALKIGAFAKTPASDWVLQNGLIEHAVFYPPQSGDPNETAGSIIERELRDGNIDVAILWGPIAGFVVNQHAANANGQQWVALPFKPDPRIKFDYEIAMGVRFGEKEWKDTLDAWISGHKDEIAQILTAYHIPLLEPSAAAPASPNS
jgi:quinoprotein dehydrogenase-associated probable ABC transporter substrate-binding protein